MLNRLKQYIDSKDISISLFEKSIGMSNASFGKSLKNGGTIGCDKLEKILNTYPDININWLIFGEGSMLKEATSTPIYNGVQENSSLYIVKDNDLVKYTLEEIKNLEHQLELKKQILEILNKQK